MFACDACGDVFNNAIHARTHDLRKCSASSSSAVVIPVTSSTVTVLPILMADDDIDFGQQPDEIVNIPNQNSGPSGTTYIFSLGSIFALKSDFRHRWVLTIVTPPALVGADETASPDFQEDINYLFSLASWPSSNYQLLSEYANTLSLSEPAILQLLVMVIRRTFL